MNRALWNKDENVKTNCPTIALLHINNALYVVPVLPFANYIIVILSITCHPSGRVENDGCFSIAMFTVIFYLW